MEGRPFNERGTPKFVSYNILTHELLAYYNVAMSDMIELNTFYGSNDLSNLILNTLKQGMMEEFAPTINNCYLDNVYDYI